eukprot:1999807-Prymnesium_polylepis.1
MPRAPHRCRAFVVVCRCLPPYSMALMWHVLAQPISRSKRASSSPNRLTRSATMSLLQSAEGRYVGASSSSCSLAASHRTKRVRSAFVTVSFWCVAASSSTSNHTPSSRFESGDESGDSRPIHRP